MTAVGGNDPQAFKSGASWSPWSEFYANDSGTWKVATNVYVNYNGTWKEVWNHAPLLSSLSASDTTPTPTVTTSGATGYGRSTATLNYSSSSNATEVFYYYRANGAGSYSESTGAVSGLSYGGSGTTYYFKAVAYNGTRTVRFTANADSNGFAFTSLKFQYGTDSSFASYSEANAILSSGTSYYADVTLANIARGSANTTIYYRLVATNASTTTTLSGGSITPSVKYSASYTSGVGNGETSFTTYASRSDAYYYTKVVPNTTSYTWGHPSIPTGGVFVDQLTVTVIGGGGGGGRTDLNGPGGMGGAGGGGGGEYKTGTIDVSNGGNASITAGRRGIGAQTITLNGDPGTSSSISGPFNSITAAGGGGGIGTNGNLQSTYPNGGSSGANAGGTGVRGADNSNYAQVGGGGGGAGGAGGNATNTAAGAGGAGTAGFCGGGGGVGTYFTGFVSVYVAGAGGSGGGGAGATSGNGYSATASGAGGGATIGNVAGYGMDGIIYVSWYGP